MPAIPPPADKPRLSAPEKDTPTFSPDKIAVVFVLGGPGAGKGTQCEFLVRDYGFTHLSAGDLLREEQDRKDSQFGGVIKDYIKEGKIVPMEITVQLLENAMTPDSKEKERNGRFLIDGECYSASSRAEGADSDLVRRLSAKDGPSSEVRGIGLPVQVHIVLRLPGRCDAKAAAEPRQDVWADGR